MAKGAFYPIYNTINLYSNAAQAQTYGSNYASTLSPNTGSDASSYNCISSVEGKGNCYVDTSVGITAYYPAFPVWWVPSWGGSGYAIGWTNDSKNAGKSTVSIPSSATIGDKVKLTINRQSSSFTHTVYVWVNGAYLTLTSSAGASYTWDTSQYANTLISDISNAASKKFEMKVETYNGSTFIGSVYPSVTLSIPVSAPTLSTTSMDIGNSVTINFNRQSSSLTHTVDYWLIGTGYTNLISKTSATSYTWNTNNYKSTLLSALPNSTSGNFQIRVSTYNGSTLIGTKYKDLKLQVPASIKPTIGTLTVTETNSAVSALGLDYFVVGISTFRTTISGHTIGEGANFKNVQFKLGGWGWVTTSSTNTTFGASGQGKPEVTAIITDSRGRSDSKTITISQTYYSVPSITGFSASRYNQENKTQVQVVLKATQTKLSNKNTMRYKLEYKKNNETTWSQLKAYSAYQSSNLDITTVQTIANDAKYNVRVSVQDKLGNTTTSILTVASTSKKWLEVTNGEDINVIGNLMENGSPVITEANSYLIESGYFSIETQASEVATKVINFTKPFIYSPIVVPVLVTTSPERATVSISARSRSSVEIKVWKDWTGEVTVGWMAIERK